MVRERDTRSDLLRTTARLLRDQGYTATGLAQVLAESGVSNGSLYHYFPGGLEELAEAALEASGQAVAEALRGAFDGTPTTADGLVRFLEIAEQPGEGCPGCPIAPAALESPIVSPRLRAAATRCFQQWQALIARRLQADGWPESSIDSTASAALSLVEGALLLARVSGETSHLANAKRAAGVLLEMHPVSMGTPRASSEPVEGAT